MENKTQNQNSQRQPSGTPDRSKQQQSPSQPANRGVSENR